MKALLYAVIALIPFGSVLTLYVLQTARKNAGIAPVEICIVLLAVAYFFGCIAEGKVPIISAPVGTLIVIFEIWAVLSLVLAASHFGLSTRESLVAGLYLARWCAYSVIYFAACALTPKYQRRALHILFAGAAVFATFGIFQAIFLPNFAFDVDPRNLPFLIPDVQGRRLVSTILDPNIAGGFLAIFALLALGLYLYGNRRFFWPTVLFSGALVLTFSRGSFAGFFTGVAILVVSRGTSWRRAAWLAAVLLCVIAALWPYLAIELRHFHRLTISDASAQSRFQDWLLAARMFRANWQVGIGYNTLSFVSPLYGNVRSGGSAFGFAGDLLLIPVTTGIVGLGLYALFVIRSMSSATKLLRGATNRWDRGFACGVRAATVSALICSLFTSVLFYPFTMAVLWLMWAHANCCSRAQRRLAAPTMLALRSPVATSR